ncbi:MAG: sulfotransferase family protein [Deltaproteobacteria bacterium]|nr:sulfotransferase family protein [Deltaproteobacteria bacterium]
MEKPQWVRRLNYIGSAVGGAVQMISLDADEMLQVATKTTGLTDFGGTGWEEPYRRLMASIQAEVQLHTLGRLMTRGDIIRALRNRLLVTDALRRNPAILEERVEAPVVIAGQGRSGTSILFELLSLDSNNRAPLAWEAASPVAPPPASLGDGITQGQIAEIVNEFWADVQPEIKAAHEHRWDLPAECIRFLDSDFTSDWWVMLYGAWSYMIWRQEANPDTAYDWHHNVIRVLQHGHPRQRWLWKSPAHLGALDRLLARYPDAKIIHTHRDPLKTIPSTVSLSSIFRCSRADNVDLNLLAQTVMMGYAGILQKVIGERTAGTIPKAQIVDSHFSTLMRDPVAAVNGIYDQLGLEFSGAFADRIRQYLRDKPRDKFGKHRYAAEDYGLSDAGIRDHFRFYTDHYGIELEGAAA